MTDWSKSSVKIEGVERTTGATGYIMDGSILVPEKGGEIPTATFTTYANRPNFGDEVIIETDATVRHFGGFVTGMKLVRYEREDKTGIQYRCNVTCSGYAWLLAQATIRASFEASTAATIITALVALCPGITLGALTLPSTVIDSFTVMDQPPLTGIKKVLEQVGGTWKVDGFRVFTAFVTGSAAAALTPSNMDLIEFSLDQGVSQHANCIYVEGGGGSALYDVLPGSGIPISNPEWFVVPGRVTSPKEQFSFSSLGGATASDGGIGSPYHGVQGTGGSLVPGKAYYYLTTIVTDRGESTQRSGGSFVMQPSLTSVTFSHLGAGQPPIQVSGFGLMKSFRVYIDPRDGGGYRRVAEFSYYEDATVVVGSIPNSGDGPPTDDGTLFYILFGSTQTKALTAGTNVNILEKAEDLAAQAAFVAMFSKPGQTVSGVVSMSLQDGRYDRANAQARAAAELARRKDIVQSQVAYKTREMVHPGDTVHIDFPSPTSFTADLVLQSTSIDLQGPSRLKGVNPIPVVTVSEASLPGDVAQFTFVNVVRALMNPIGSPTPGNYPRPSSLQLPAIDSATAAPPAPVPTTQTATLVTDATTTLTGLGNPEGLPTSGWFEYENLITQETKQTTPVALGSGLTNAAITGGAITGLDPYTTYRFRAVVQSAGGVVEGSWVNFTMDPPAIAWTEVATDSTSNSLIIKKSIYAEALGMFVAVGQRSSGVARIYTSVDEGATWQVQNASEGNTWTGIAWSPSLSLLVAVASGGTNRVMTSPDGINWTNHTAAEANAWQDVTWAGTLGLFVAVASSGTNRTMTSANGTAWTAVAASSAKSWGAIAWSGSELVATAGTSGTTSVMRSTTGLAASWADQTTPITVSFRNRGLGWLSGLNLFAACAGSGHLLTSPTGVTWTDWSGVPSGWGSNDNNQIAWNAALNVAVVTSGSSTYNVLVTSDATTWVVTPTATSGPLRTWDAIASSDSLGKFALFDQSSHDVVMIGTGGTLPAQVTPSSGDPAGGNYVALFDATLGFVAGDVASIGGVDGTDSTVQSPTLLTFIAPAGRAGTSKDIVVTRP